MTTGKTVTGSLLCLVSDEARSTGKDALAVLSLFGTICEVLFVETSSFVQSTGKRAHQSLDSERQLLEMCGQSGLTTRVNSLPFTDALERVASMQSEDLLVIAQPSHPLDRQTLPFTRMNAAALQTRSAILYVPPGDHSAKSQILVVERQDQSYLSKLEKHGITFGSRSTRYLDPTTSFEYLRQEYVRQAVSDRPAVLVVTLDWISRQAVTPSRIAASLETPILIVR